MKILWIVPITSPDDDQLWKEVGSGNRNKVLTWAARSKDGKEDSPLASNNIRNSKYIVS